MFLHAMGTYLAHGNLPINTPSVTQNGVRKPANPVTQKGANLFTIPTVGIPVRTDSKRACHIPILLKNRALPIQLPSDLVISD